MGFKRSLAWNLSGQLVVQHTVLSFISSVAGDGWVKGVAIRLMMEQMLWYDGGNPNINQPTTDRLLRYMADRRGILERRKTYGGSQYRVTLKGRTDVLSKSCEQMRQEDARAVTEANISRGVYLVTLALKNVPQIYWEEVFSALKKRYQLRPLPKKNSRLA